MSRRDTWENTTVEDRLDTPVAGNRAQRRAAQRTKKVAALGSGMVLAAAGASTALTLASSAPAGANTTIVVSTTADTGAGSLRQAILDANTASGQDTVTFSVTGTITLASDLPHITDALKIQGPGPAALTVDGASTFQIFEFENVAASSGVNEVSGLTITHGVGKDPDTSGGGISIWQGDAPTTIANDVITANHAGNDGGGVHEQSHSGSVVVTGTTISNNVADAGGGGLYFDSTSPATLSISDSTITGNSSGDNGGGLYAIHTDVTITNSTINFNEAGGNGGGVAAGQGTLHVSGSFIGNNTASAGGGLSLYNNESTIEFTTISGNQSTNDGGGGLYANDDATDSNLTVRNTTISGNTSQYYGGGLYLDNSGTTDIQNSTISGNTAALNGGGAAVGYQSTGFSMTQTTVTNNTATSPDSGPAVGGVLVATPLPTVAAARKSARAAKAADKAPGEHTKPDHAKGQGVRAAVVDSIAVTGTIVSGNAGEDIGAFDPLTVNSDHSIIGTVGTHVTVTDLGGSQLGLTDPGLLPLADNGGPTQTHALAVGSPAKDKGPSPVPTFPGNDFDQRGAGFARVVDGTVDVGAFEAQAPVPIDIAPKFTG